jgi:hypothetical protein
MAEGGAVISEGSPPCDGRFLGGAGLGGNAPGVLAGDASFRRYYRLVEGSRRAC